MCSLRRDMSCAPVSPGELETCMCIVPKTGKKYQVIIVPDEEFPRCLECLKPDRTLDVYEYGWVSFAYRLTLRRRGTPLTSTQRRDLRSLLKRNTALGVCRAAS